MKGVFIFWLRVYNLLMGILFWKNKGNDLPTGAYGERIAAKYLKGKKYKIIEMNFKNPSGRRLGEIDIIAKKGKEIVFVEVKTRRLPGYENTLPEENITPMKLRKLNKAGQFYIRSKNLWDFSYRFDAVSVWIMEDGRKAKIKHIENIFY